MTPPIEELLASSRFSAVHLELRDVYTPRDPVFLDWKTGTMGDPAVIYADWMETVRSAVKRGVAVKRARIISEPLSEFIRHEYEVTGLMNLPAGEEVRWLPRRRTSDLALPGNDFWVFDDQAVRFGYFAGDGEFIENEVTQDKAIIRLCMSAFQAVWERAIAHEDYRPE